MGSSGALNSPKDESSFTVLGRFIFGAGNGAGLANASSLGGCCDDELEKELEGRSKLDTDLCWGLTEIKDVRMVREQNST